MTEQHPITDRPVAAALAEAARAAGAAPSYHNTQPWRWVVRDDALELYAERSRQLTVGDPEGRMLTISCGCALHHARVALAAEGWQVRVSVLPDPSDADLLARLVPGERTQVSGEQMRLYQTIALRHTDRRPVTASEVPAASLDALIRAAEAQGARLQVLRPEQVDDLAVAVAHAASVDAEDAALQAELTRWTTHERPSGAGLPASVIPAQQPQTEVPARVFARSGTLPVGGDHDRTAVYALLYGETDDPAGWLVAGQALSAIWLVSVELGLGLLPVSEAVEMPATRQNLRRVIAFFGWPYLAVRLGIPDPDHPGPEHTPRLPAEQTVDTSAVGTPAPADPPEADRR